MTAPTIDGDARVLGFTISGNTISTKDKQVGSLRIGADVARVTVERSVGKATVWAHLSTPLNRRSQMVGKAVIIVTVRCPDATLIAQCHIKHEVTARRFAAGVNAWADAWKVHG